MDVFGGVKGVEFAKINPFEEDRKKVLQDIRLSIDMFEGRKRRKKSVLQSMRDGTFGQAENAPNWEYNAIEESHYDVILRWGDREIARVKNIPRKEASIALTGLKVFIETINTNDPDFTHPEIAKCYNLTAKKYKLDPVPVPAVLDRTLHRHPFAGITGDLRDLKNNAFARDVLRAQEQVDFTCSFLEQVELPVRKREAAFRVSKTLFAQPTFEHEVSHFNLTFIFANEVIREEIHVPVHRAKVAMASLRGWLKKIDVEMPNLSDTTLKKCYEATKQRTKPDIRSVSDERLLSIEDGGATFWSEKQHRWIAGRIKKNGDFEPPDWAL